MPDWTLCNLLGGLGLRKRPNEGGPVTNSWMRYTQNVTMTVKHRSSFSYKNSKNIMQKGDCDFFKILLLVHFIT